VGRSATPTAPCSRRLATSFSRRTSPTASGSASPRFLSPAPPFCCLLAPLVFCGIGFAGRAPSVHASPWQARHNGVIGFRPDRGPAPAKGASTIALPSSLTLRRGRLVRAKPQGRARIFQPCARAGSGGFPVARKEACRETCYSVGFFCHQFFCQDWRGRCPPPGALMRRTPRATACGVRSCVGE